MRHLRRKLPLRAHDEQIVFVKRKHERFVTDKGEVNLSFDDVKWIRVGNAEAWS